MSTFPVVMVFDILYFAFESLSFGRYEFDNVMILVQI